MADASTGVVGYSVEALANLFGTLDKSIGDLSATAISNLTDPLLTLTGTLAVISIASNWDMYFNSNFNWGNIITKIIHIGFFMWLIRNWLTFTAIIRDSATKLGIYASSGTEHSAKDIITKGVSSVFTYLGFLFEHANKLETIVIALMSIVLIVVAVYAFCKIAYTIFMTKAEFTIMAALSMVLLPFSQTKWTKSMSEKTWGILLTTGIKLMVATFMIGMLYQHIDTAFAIPKIGETYEVDQLSSNFLPSMFSSTLALFFLSYLVSKVTEFAGAMANGHLIQSRNIAENVGAMAQGYAAGGARAAMNYAGRHTGAAAKEAAKDVGKGAWEAAKNPWNTTQRVGNAAIIAATNPIGAAGIAGGKAYKYGKKLHHAGDRKDPFKPIKEQLDRIEDKVQ